MVMDIITAETLRERLANLTVKNFGVHAVFRQTILFASFVVMIAGNTLADWCSRMSPELVDGLMFLHGLK